MLSAESKWDPNKKPIVEIVPAAATPAPATEQTTTEEEPADDDPFGLGGDKTEEDPFGL